MEATAAGLLVRGPVANLKIVSAFRKVPAEKSLQRLVRRGGSLSKVNRFRSLGRRQTDDAQEKK